MEITPYEKAQTGLTMIKSAIHVLLLSAGEEGLKNSEIGRRLGIYGGHEGHEGHISRTMLAHLEAEGLVKQDKDKKTWSIR
jgi:hypothetical protein